MPLGSPSILRSVVLTACGSLAGWGCGGKGGEPLVISTPVIEDAPDPAEPLDSGGASDTAGSGEPPPQGDFWHTAVLSGGDAGQPDQYFDGDTVQVTSGSVRLGEEGESFVIELLYAGSISDVPYQVRCRVPIDFVGGLPATAADAASGTGTIGCASLSVGSTQYSVDPDGLTVVTINDGRTVEAEVSLIVQSEAGGILQTNGDLYARLCDTFWSGAPCTY